MTATYCKVCGGFQSGIYVGQDPCTCAEVARRKEEIAAAVEKARRDALRELGEQLGPDGWVNGDALVGLANKNTPPTEG